MKWIDYREKLGLGFNDKQKYSMLKNNIIEFLSNIESYYSKTDYQRYVVMVGELTDRYAGSSINGVIKSIERCKSMPELISKYIALYNSYCVGNHPLEANQRKEVKEAIIEYIKNRMVALGVPFEIIEDDGIFVFPKGAIEFDEALVSEPLEWLYNYPKARQTFCVALKQYSDGMYVRDVADNLRKALETFLQEFLKNTKNLEGNKDEVCKYLGSQGVDHGFAGLFQTIINTYKNINDRIAKHNDKVDPRLLEFILYQTGLLIRMVISVKQSEVNDNAN